MRGMLYKGSSPKEELEFAKTALALGQPVDAEALIDAFEKYLEKEDTEIQDLKREVEYWKDEVAYLEKSLQDLKDDMDPTVDI